jgi:predicted dehydrogenase
MMRALIIGYGSIGARHARLLAEMGFDVSVVSRRPSNTAGFYPDLATALSGPSFDYAVIANEASLHVGTLSALASHGYTGPVLIEKPLADDNTVATLPEKGPYYVGYNLRFLPVLIALKQALAGHTVLSAEISCGSWLPDWRPNRDYRETSSARLAAGGGVLNDLSHELDYTMWLLGPWRRLTAIGGRVSQLQIDTDDLQMILMETTACPAVSISLNYLDRQPRRRTIINTDCTTFIADLEAGTLQVGADMLRVEAVPIDETYRRQHRAILYGQHYMACSYDHGRLVVDTMAAIRKAATGGLWLRHDNGESM